MKINKLSLYNYGFYYGENIFNFNTQNSKNNIVLIGGTNGAGKSTILEAIMIALYGSLYLGYKSNTNKYNSFIDNMINYNIDDNKNKKMYLKLDIEINRKGNMINYQLKREWNTNNLKENLIIYKNDKLLNEEEKDNLVNYIRKVYPPSLFDFFLFDGEKISDKLYKDEFQSILKKIFYKIFNLSILSTLKNDLNNVLSTKTNENSTNEIENEYIKIKQDLEEINQKINNNEEMKSDIQEKVKDLRTNYHKTQEEFKLNGGQFANERESLNRKISKLEEQKKLYREEVKELNETLLPFSINTNILNNALDQISNEREYLNYKNLSKRINQTKIKNKIHEEISSELNNNYNQNVTENILTIIESTLKPNINDDNFNVIHNFSPGEEDKLKNQIYNINNINNEDLSNKIREIPSMNNEIKKYKNLLKENKENSDLQDLLNKMDEINQQINKFESEIEEIDFILEGLIERKEEIQDQKDKIYKQLVKSKKEESIPVVCEKLENVINKYNNKKVKTRLTKLEKEFLNIVNELFTINKYITDIKIDPETFEIKVYNNKKDLKGLSSGEQQLVILALLWSLVKLSKQKLPIIFDTLLGRIDSDHRQNIINNLINNSNEQIIVLATDSEINSSFYNEIKPYLVREYLLSKENKLNHKASIYEKKYFYEGVKNG